MAASIIPRSYQSQPMDQFFSTPSTPLAITLELLGVPWVNPQFPCAMTYTDKFLAEHKRHLVSRGKWEQEAPFTPQDAQRLDLVDQCTYFFQKTPLLSVVLKGWEKGCQAIKDTEFRVQIDEIQEEEAATLLAIALGPNGKRARMIGMMKGAVAKLAVQSENGDWTFFGKDASAETIQHLTQ